MDSLTVGMATICRMKFHRASLDEVAHLYPTAEDARITTAIVHAAALVRDLNFKYTQQGKGAPVTSRFGDDGIIIVDPMQASEGANAVFKRIYEKAL